jgi:hypothetical protein
MRKLLTLLLMLVMLVAAACDTGDEDTGTTDTDDEEPVATEPADSPPLAVEVEPVNLPAVADDAPVLTFSVVNDIAAEDVTGQFAQMLCTTERVSYLFEEADGLPIDLQLSIFFPPGTSPGEYALGPDLTAAPVGIGVNLTEVDTNYDTPIGGNIRLDGVPTAEGETFTGAFYAVIGQDAGDSTLEISGTFNLEATMFEVCPADG